MNIETQEVAIATIHLSERTKIVDEVDLSTFEKTDTLEEDIKFWAREYAFEDLDSISQERLRLDLLNTPVTIHYDKKYHLKIEE